MKVSRFNLSVIVSVLSVALPVFVSASYADADGALGSVVQRTGHNTASLTDTIGIIIPAAFSTLGLIFLALAVYAGFRWMLARGNEDQITEARTTLTNAAIGMIIVVSGYTITNFITARLIDGKQDVGSVAGGGGNGGEDIGCCRIELTTQWSCSVQTFSQCEQYAKGKSNMNFDSLEGFIGEDENFYWDSKKTSNEKNAAGKYTKDMSVEEFTNHCTFTCTNEFLNAPVIP